jgi:hypothetical protein
MSEEQKPKGPVKPKLSDVSEQDIINKLLGNLPSVTEVPVELPSKNKFYSLPDPTKPITLRAMTFEDEKAMMSNKNVNIDVLNKLLSRCVSNIGVEHLLQMDKLYLIMKLRELSYGEDYNATINCPNCKKDNDVSFKVSQLPVTYLEDDATDPVEITLPILDKKVKVRRPRVADENYFSNAEYALTNLWRFIEEIEGYTQKTVISKVISQLPLKDAHAVVEALSASDYGVNTKVRFVCDYCGNNEIMELPITADFFTES